MLFLRAALRAPPFVFQPARMGGCGGGHTFGGKNVEEEEGFHN